MTKEKIYIVLSHKHSIKRGTKEEWEVIETVEFVNQLRNKHVTMSSAIGDYLNMTMVSGKRFGMTEYSKFEEYIRKKYEKELNQLDNLYRSDRAEDLPKVETITDQFGSVREKTVFD